MPSKAEEQDKAEQAGGFTLLEILVVIILLALVIGLVVGAGPAESPAASLESAADRVAGALRLARGEAIAHDRRVAVTLDPLARTLRAGTDPASRLAAGVVVVTTVTNETPHIVFAPDGTASGGPIILAAGELRREIGVNWLTGEVTEGPAVESDAGTASP